MKTTVGGCATDGCARRGLAARSKNKKMKQKQDLRGDFSVDVNGIRIELNPPGKLLGIIRLSRRGHN